MSKQAIGKLPLQGTESGTAWSVAHTIVALRQLTEETGTHTTRTQNHILQSLSDTELAEVARVLAFVGKN